MSNAASTEFPNLAADDFIVAFNGRSHTSEGAEFLRTTRASLERQRTFVRAVLRHPSCECSPRRVRETAALLAAYDGLAHQLAQLEEALGQAER